MSCIRYDWNDDVHVANIGNAGMDSVHHPNVDDVDVAVPVRLVTSSLL